MMWRYQSVYEETDEGVKSYTICEVYLDEDGKLKTWTESKSMHPYGDSIEELEKDLKMMIADVQKWKPIALNKLEIGMVFEKR